MHFDQQEKVSDRKLNNAFVEAIDSILRSGASYRSERWLLILFTGKKISLDVVNQWLRLHVR